MKRCICRLDAIVQLVSIVVDRLLLVPPLLANESRLVTMKSSFSTLDWGSNIVRIEFSVGHVYDVNLSIPRSIYSCHHFSITFNLIAVLQFTAARVWILCIRHLKLRATPSPARKRQNFDVTPGFRKSFSWKYIYILMPFQRRKL